MPTNLQIRRADERGHTQIDWLNSYHTFSFGEYYDADFMGFKTLRVINDDRITPAAGFGTHPHRDMEIITVVLEGALQHKDSMGTGSVIRPGDVQIMSAGTGVTHSEFNASKTEPCHFLQIWIIPESRGLMPAYQQKSFGEQWDNQLTVLASHDGRENSLNLHQDVVLLGAKLTGKSTRKYMLPPGRSVWVQVFEGAVDVNGTKLNAGDGAALSGAADLNFSTEQSGGFLLFDLA